MVSSCKYETCWIEQQVDEKAKQQQLFLDTEMQHEWNNDTVKQTAVQKHRTFSAELDQPINGTSSHYICPRFLLWINCVVRGKMWQTVRFLMANEGARMSSDLWGSDFISWVWIAKVVHLLSYLLDWQDYCVYTPKVMLKYFTLPQFTVRMVR